MWKGHDSPVFGSANMMVQGKLQLVFNELLHVFGVKTLLRIQALTSRSISFLVSFFLILKALNLSTLELSR